MSISGDKDAEVIEAFTSMSRYLDDLLTLIIPILQVWPITFTDQNFS